MKKPALVLIAVVVVSWMLLLLSFFGMAMAFKLTAGLHGLSITIIRDLLGLLLFAIWAALFFIMRQLAAKALKLY
ncbi:MAG: hypothetical protein JRN26_06365 [Nitrososphaerota archaeon]|jgi:hypothetical protein|nr:hypothetical protein [Nitrososphaerota archaeon]MDG6927146.1 hypothetical protein [Nitrososphaerota archaeon]MDG6931170.1 hypothetical protein [Nitrososphaerota archaeon]MDG6932310.1 hypothetical protein [Nitrososphaerota archaeon]MDG6936486.1 hypothetical protein [Nitrososphaerota archaeon]